jgi:hypothetical protein
VVRTPQLIGVAQVIDILQIKWMVMAVKESFSTLELTVLLLLLLLLLPIKCIIRGSTTQRRRPSVDIDVAQGFDLLLAADMILTNSEVPPVLAQNLLHQHCLIRSHYTEFH